MENGKLVSVKKTCLGLGTLTISLLPREMAKIDLTSDTREDLKTNIAKNCYFDRSPPQKKALKNLKIKNKTNKKENW